MKFASFESREAFLFNFLDLLKIINMNCEKVFMHPDEAEAQEVKWIGILG